MSHGLLHHLPPIYGSPDDPDDGTAGHVTGHPDYDRLAVDSRGDLVRIDRTTGRIRPTTFPLAIPLAELDLDDSGVEMASLHGPAVEVSNTGGTLYASVVLPAGFHASGGLMLEVVLTGDGSGNAVADFTAAIQRQRSGDTLSGTFLTSVPASVMVNGTLGVLVTRTFTLFVEGSAVDYRAGDLVRIRLVRASDDSYGGSILIKAMRLRAP